jgi:hypothetical protein
MVDRSFADKAIAKRTKRVHHSGNCVRGQEDDSGLRGHSANLDGGLYAIHHRHIYVENDDIGLELADLFDGLFSIGGLAAYFEGMLLQKIPERASHHGDVIHQKHSGPHGHLFSTQR